MVEFTPFASGSSGNCYRITDGRTPLLLECGIPYKKIQKGMNFRLSQIAGCLVTHEHKDHCKAAQDIMMAGVDVYASWGTFNALHLGGHRSNVVGSLKQFTVGTWTILPFDIQHDAAEPLGFLLANQAGEKVLYITDSYYCRYRFQGLTHIMIETNYSLDILNGNVEAGNIPPEMKKRVMRSHMSLETAKEFLKANDLSKVEQIWLIHLSDGNSDAERFKREVQELTGKPTYIA
jgi:phosphoribosyl 1,2-cyclic phosphodiesterase